MRDRSVALLGLNCFFGAYNHLGLVSGNLAPYVKSILGVDISQGVVDLFNKRFADRGADQERFRAIRAELKGEDGELANEKFDVIIVRKSPALSVSSKKRLTNTAIRIVHCCVSPFRRRISGYSTFGSFPETFRRPHSHRQYGNPSPRRISSPRPT